MENRDDDPTENVPSDYSHLPKKQQAKEAQEAWLKEKLGQFVDQYIFTAWSGKAKKKQVRVYTVDRPELVKIKLANGKVFLVRRVVKEEVMSEKGTYHITSYAHIVLELGMVSHLMLELCCTPDRKHLLSLFKMMLVIMKTER